LVSIYVILRCMSRQEAGMNLVSIYVILRCMSRQEAGMNWLAFM